MADGPGYPSPPSALDKLAGELLQIVRPQIDIETAREAATAVIEVVERRRGAKKSRTVEEMNNGSYE